MTAPATTDRVAVAWVKGITGITADQVGTGLPEDNTTWATAGFVQVSTAGGAPGYYAPLRAPVVQIDCWANRPNSNKPPWNLAAKLAETVLAGFYAAPEVIARDLDLGTAYAPARVLTAYPLTEPRSVRNDPAGYARRTFDVALRWVEVPA